MTVIFFDTVRRTLTSEIVPLHDTRETATLRGTRYIHSLNGRKDIDRDLSADFQSSRSAELANKPFRLATGLRQQLHTSSNPRFGPLAVELGHMATLATSSQTTRLIKEPQLNCFVAVSIQISHLQHTARPGRNDRDRNSSAVFAINLCHPDLTAKYSARHR